MIDLPGIPPLELTEQLRFILDLGGAVGAAVIGGAIAVRLRQPAILGYLLAGIVIGTFTAGFIGDVQRITVLADVGVVLLLFALGVQFSIHELRDVGRVALPGGAAQVLLVLGAGAATMVGLGSDLREALVVGACLSLSSTLVVLKSLLDRGELDSLHGRAAIGWSIVQDIATIVFIVALLPSPAATWSSPSRWRWSRPASSSPSPMSLEPGSCRGHSEPLRASGPANSSC
jgi:Kef-type K+ transport system, predicted NAD-binding component